VVPIELSGALSLEGSLEGPFLECVYAAHLLLKGKRVVERSMTGGVQHDVLVEDAVGFEFYELTGQASIERDKVARFRDAINQLADYLKKEGGGRRLVRAYFVSMTAEEAWSEDAKKVLEQLRKDSIQRLSCEVHHINGVAALKQIIESGALGLRLVNDGIYFAGPEEYAIRYDPGKGWFDIGFANLDLYKFRSTPFSFLPSHFWEMYYHSRVREVFGQEYKEKGEELTIWTYPYYEGLKWPSLDSLVNLYAEYLNSINRTYPKIMEEAGLKYVFETHKSRRGNYSYILHLFSLAEVVDKQNTSSLRGIADHIATKMKDQIDYLKDERIYVAFHSASDVWTLNAWSKIRRPVPEHLKDVIGEEIHVERGNELLKSMLNRGILGLSFRSKNQITLRGPGAEAVRRSYNFDLKKYELMVADKPIYP
jgi:hypothetical protein